MEDDLPTNEKPHIYDSGEEHNFRIYSYRVGAEGGIENQLIAIKNGSICGRVGVFQEWDVAYIRQIHVLHKERRKGLGRELIYLCEHFAVREEKAIKEIRVKLVPSDSDAVPFFVEMGYSVAVSDEDNVMLLTKSIDELYRD
jgi:N-acetylglutamate synthase-like GNAT family acetyltransferase